MPPFRPAATRFYEKVEKTPTCWLWTGARHAQGYGVLRVGTVRENNRRNAQAHRFAYELLVGPIPDGFELDHLCRVRHCVNPEHLEPVSHTENVRRGIGGLATAATYANRTHCKQGHPYTPENTRLSGRRRFCRTCQRASSAAWKQKRRAAKE